MRYFIGVIGMDGEISEEVRRIAEETGREIAKRIFEIEPPIPYVYEFFLVNGEKMSASVGNVYIAQDILKIIEPEIFLYFYTKKPGKQRDLDLKRINLLVEDFEHVERVYFGEEEEKNERERKNLIRMYEMSNSVIPKTRPLRIPYTFSAMITQVVPEERMLESAIEILKRTGHIKGRVSEEDRKGIEKRLILAKNWAEHYAPEQYKIRIMDEPDPSIVEKLSSEQKRALKFLAEELKDKKMSEEELYSLFWEISKKHDLKPQQFFQAVYLALLGRDSGPRLAPFITVIGQERVAAILERI